MKLPAEWHKIGDGQMQTTLGSNQVGVALDDAALSIAGMQTHLVLDSSRPFQTICIDSLYPLHSSPGKLQRLPVKNPPLPIP